MRPAHAPTEATRATVEALAGVAGLRQDQIAAFLGIDAKTLRRHYRAELDRAAVVAVGQVAQALFTKAMSGDTVAQIFFLKRRLPEVWGDRAGEGGDDPPAPTRVVIQVRDARLTPEP